MRLICEKYKSYQNKRFQSDRAIKPMNTIGTILITTVVITVLMCWLIPSPWTI